MSSEVIWLISLLIVLAVAYYIGYRDGANKNPPLSEEARIEIEKYQLDKFYEQEHWKIERGIKNGSGNV